RCASLAELDLERVARDAGHRDLLLPQRLAVDLLGQALRRPEVGHLELAGAAGQLWRADLSHAGAPHSELPAERLQGREVARVVNLHHDARAALLRGTERLDDRLADLAGDLPLLRLDQVVGALAARVDAHVGHLAPELPGYLRQLAAGRGLEDAEVVL